MSSSCSPVEASLQVSHLGLYSDSRFPGRALLAFDHHATQLDELGDNGRNASWAGATAVAGAIKQATGSAVNYAVLGNANAHLHVHLIPRRPESEPLPTRPPWNALDRSKNPARQLRTLLATLQRILASS